MTMLQCGTHEYSSYRINFTNMATCLKAFTGDIKVIHRYFCMEQSYNLCVRVYATDHMDFCTAA